MSASIPGESDLIQRKCKPCEGGTTPHGEFEIRQAVGQLEGWAYQHGELVRTCTFKNYYETMAFVNAVAWLSHREDHHPVMEVGYKTCQIRYSTHAIKGISDNDFICAAKVNKLLRG